MLPDKHLYSLETVKSRHAPRGLSNDRSADSSGNALHECVIFIISLCDDQLLIFVYAKPHPPREDPPLHHLLERSLERLKVCEELFNEFLELANGFFFLDLLRVVQDGPEEKVVEVRPNGMPQLQVMEPCSLLSQYQILIHQFLIFTSMLLKDLHLLGMDELEVEFEAFRAEQPSEILVQVVQVQA
eukprot:CAMPEP_0170544712 /NCGR_PEP_ID=MMETSP0211-20121228/3369_1 /TAXON_ID=311385 /ORGANISM="Pseudokeronopsis sp., Strain OXSARD2" /LENGTH=185 /DNA_ID=CAMNT_0010848423 /DNA_START=79 /DNA_END=637 /DNA_ORIENTATION=-